MYIAVKYGNNETLICNPYCAVVNLLTSIKRRAGFGHNAGMVVDLSDETGLVKELDSHKYDNATKYLASHGTYILVRKEAVAMDTLSVDSGNVSGQQYNYVPLLENPDEMFPNYKLHVDSIPVIKPSRKGARKSPSPAGRFGTKSVKKSADVSSSSKKSSKKR